MTRRREDEWTRRRFLVTAGGVAAGTLVGAALGDAASSPTIRSTPAAGGNHKPRAGVAMSPALTAAAADLRRLVTGRALTVDDPWVLMHAVLPLGADARHGDEPILDYVTRTWLEPVARGGAQYAAFPLKVEAHPNHFLEIMYATAVPPERAFASRMGRVTRADLTRGAKALFTPAIQGDELSWTVSVLTAESKPDADRFENADGRAFTVSAVVEAAAQAGEAGYADTVAAMRGTKPYGRSAVQEYACNGTHVVYAVLDAVRNGYRGSRLPERATALLQALLYRLGPEVALIDKVIGAEPGAQLNADAAKLQFLGHAIENARFAQHHHLYAPTPAEQAAIATAEEQLAGIAHRLTTTYDLDTLARQVPRAYSLILGDACHALHAAEIEVA
ncbi:MAG: hypothetical protein E6J72_17225 [Deltaproteobacteria bacterium]|nr:MAG: hypothetical protein E6J72_17225 [Deltaproteobacteria bacterium]